MKIKGFLVMAFAAVMMCVNVFAAYADPVVKVYYNDRTGGYSIETNSGTKECSDIVLLYINGNIIPEAEAVIKNGATLVPLRVISNRLGAEVSWNSSSKTAAITSGSSYITATVGNYYITVNGNTVSTTAPTQIINSLTYVPLRAIASAFGADVGYNGRTFQGGVQIVWVQNRSEAVSISKTEAAQIAKNTYFYDFLPEMYSYISSVYNINAKTLTPDNIGSKIAWLGNFTCSCEADLGQYYYIKFFDKEGTYGALVDKYDGSCYPVSAYSVTLFDIAEEGSSGMWGLIYQ